MTWLELPPDSLFGVANLPYGVFEAGGEPGPAPGSGSASATRCSTWRPSWTTRCSPGRR